MKQKDPVKMMVEYTVEGYDGERVEKSNVQLDERIHCPYCGVKGQMWISEYYYNDRTDDELCLCVACGYTAYGLQWDDDFDPSSCYHYKKVLAIKQELEKAKGVK